MDKSAVFVYKVNDLNVMELRRICRYINPEQKCRGPINFSIKNTNKKDLTKAVMDHVATCDIELDDHLRNMTGSRSRKLLDGVAQSSILSLGVKRTAKTSFGHPNKNLGVADKCRKKAVEVGADENSEEVNDPSENPDKAKSRIQGLQTIAFLLTFPHHVFYRTFLESHLATSRGRAWNSLTQQVWNNYYSALSLCLKKPKE